MTFSFYHPLYILLLLFKYMRSSTGDTEDISKRIDPSAVVETNQIDSYSFVGAGSKIKEKTSVKTSTLGEHCIVSSKSRLTKCILMKNVFISEG